MKDKGQFERIGPFLLGIFKGVKAEVNNADLSIYTTEMLAFFSVFGGGV